MTYDQFTAAWLTNNNPGNTPYEVSLSTDNFVTNFSTPIAFASFLSGTTTFTGLTPSTMYAVRVRAENGDGVASGFSAIDSTQTLTAPPAHFAGTALGVSSISWTWDAVSGASSYSVYPASNPAVPIATVGSPGWIETGLSTNTAYGRVVTVTVGIVQSALSDSATVYTLADAPARSSITVVTTVSAALTWSVATNPNGTSYQALISEQSNFVSFVSSTTVLSTATFNNLLSNATYYLEVRALNGDGFPTAYDVVQDTVTPAAIPVNGALNTVSSNTITIDWGASTNINGTLYEADLSTISALGASTATVVGSVTSVSFADLIPGTTYYARVKALGRDGADSDYLQIGQAVTTFPPPTNPRFIDVEVSSLTAAWDNIPQPGIQYVTELQDMFDAFSTVTTSTTVLSTVTFSGLKTNEPYSFRLRSQDQTSLIYSAYSNVVSTYTLANAPVNLATTTVASNSVGLSWGNGGNPGWTSYSVERSTDGFTSSRWPCRAAWLIRTSRFRRGPRMCTACAHGAG